MGKEIMKINIVTLGCALNQGDSLLIKQILEREGHSITDNLEEADAVIINTCTVRKESEEKSLKAIERAYKLNPKAKIIATGCMASAQPFTLKKRFPRITLVSPENILRISDVVASTKPIALLTPDNSKRKYVPTAKKGAIAIIPINDGCLGNCSFCITVRGRRRLLSREPRKIVEAIKRLVERERVYEIQLASQDSAVYGIDLRGRPLLPQLIMNIHDNVKGKYMLRIGMMNPDKVYPILDELIEAYRLPHTYKFLHLPVQSGDNKVLKIMNRGYTVEEYKEIISEFREKVPGITIATDIIVGHPGEDEEAFENTISLVKELEFERIHIARFTPRPLTLSARLKQVPDAIKKERSKKLTLLYEEIGKKKLSKFIGKRLRGVLVENWGFGAHKSYTARTDNYVSIVIQKRKDLSLGETLDIKITSATYYDLRGEPIYTFS
jgi:threonylcarbamoyladenosine tRNA methylthiotransferase CDKAL1